MNLPTWEQINEIGKLKILRIAMVFFVLMPIFVRFFEHIPKQIYLPVLERSYLFELSLPFNWFLLYLASLSITLGGVLYHLSCPKIIKLFSHYYDYNKSGMTKSFLCNELKKCISKNDRQKNSSDIVRKLIKKNDYNLDVVKDKDEVDNIIKALDPNFKINACDYDHAMKSTFYFLKDTAQLKAPIVRFFTTLFYVIGLSLVLYVVFEKVLYVLNYVYSGTSW